MSASAPGRGSSWEREYRDLEGAIRLRNYSGKTLEAYRLWVGKFQGFVRSLPTGELGTEEVRGCLWLIVETAGMGSGERIRSRSWLEEGQSLVLEHQNGTCARADWW